VPCHRSVTRQHRQMLSSKQLCKFASRRPVFHERRNDAPSGCTNPRTPFAATPQMGEPMRASPAGDMAHLPVYADVSETVPPREAPRSACCPYSEAAPRLSACAAAQPQMTSSSVRA